MKIIKTETFTQIKSFKVLMLVGFLWTWFAEFSPDTTWLKYIMSLPLLLLYHWLINIEIVVESLGLTEKTLKQLNGTIMGSIVTKNNYVNRLRLSKFITFLPQTVLFIFLMIIVVTTSLSDVINYITTNNTDALIINKTQFIVLFATYGITILAMLLNGVKSQISGTSGLLQ